MSLRLPLLVTGVTGVAGLHAFRHLHARHPGQVIGTRPHQTSRLTGPDIVPLDAEDAAGMRRLFDEYGFRSVLNAVGNCALKSCELDPAMARTVNVASAAALIDAALRHESRIVHLSSDLVFSGSHAGNYRETDPTDPVTVYGKTMVEAERLFAERLPAAAILRISLPMGPSFNRHAGAIDWIQSRFRNGRPATLYFDEVRSAAYVDDLTRVFVRFLAGSESGIWHLGGPRANTLHQIGQIVNRAGDYESRLLHGCPRIEAGPMPPRAGNCTMNSDRLVQLFDGESPLAPWPCDQELHPTGRDWHHDRPAEQLRGAERIASDLYAYDGAAVVG
jgi:dTDP-4-dehydrorhamnose reductase